MHLDKHPNVGNDAAFVMFRLSTVPAWRRNHFGSRWTYYDWNRELNEQGLMWVSFEDVYLTEYDQIRLFVGMKVTIPQSNHSAVHPLTCVITCYPVCALRGICWTAHERQMMRSALLTISVSNFGIQTAVRDFIRLLCMRHENKIRQFRFSNMSVNISLSHSIKWIN